MNLLIIQHNRYFLLKAYRNNDNFNEKDALKLLHKLINKYAEFSNLTVKEYYNDYIHGNYQTDEFSSKIGSYGSPH